VITGGGNRTTWALNPVVPAVAGAAAPPAPPVATNLSFLGFGISFPLRRGLANDYATAGGVDQVKSRVRNIVGTKRGTPVRPGELPWRGEFGNRASLLRHSSNTSALGKMAQQYVMEALANWEPCVRVAISTIRRDPGSPRKLWCRTVYDVLTSNPAGNQVMQAGQAVEVPLVASAG
jgi:phage baseplate assembly protein W